MGRRDYFEGGLTQSVTGPVQSADELFQLGLNYATGRQVTYNLVTAHKWLSIAAMQGSKRARRLRTEIAGELTRAELRKAQRDARSWLKRNRML